MYNLASVDRPTTEHWFGYSVKGSVAFLSLTSWSSASSAKHSEAGESSRSTMGRGL